MKISIFCLRYNHETFINKPVILLGRGLYESLDVAYTPQSKEEFNNLLMQTKLEPKSQKNTAIYGYYMKTHGIRHLHYEPIDHKKGTFMGVNLQKFDFLKIKESLLKIFFRKG